MVQDEYADAFCADCNGWRRQKIDLWKERTII